MDEQPLNLSHLDPLFRDNSLNGMAVVSGAGHFLKVNPRCCELLGYSEEQLLSLTFQEITHPQDLQPDVNQYQRVLDGEIDRYKMQKRYISGYDNRDVWATLNVQGYRNTDGSFAYFISEIAEVYDRRLSSEERYRLQQIKTGIATGQFLLHYQPIVDLATREVLGYEALARWATKGAILGPMSFAPLLQASSNVHLLCHEIIKHASIVAPLLSPRWLSININPLTITRPDWPEYAAVFPRSAHLEVLELGLSRQDQESLVIERLTKLRQQGVALALDDFGSGYNSFRRLQSYGVSIIKLDKSLVTNLPSDDTVAMCRAIVAMAKPLNLKVIAEGVETKEQAQVLQEMGCDMGQGYLFGKPMPLAELD